MANVNNAAIADAPASEVARMNLMVKRLEAIRDRCFDQINDLKLEISDMKIERRYLPDHEFSRLVRVFRELRGGDAKFAIVEFERLLDELDLSWGEF